jgi:hypothetical protein
MARRITGGGWVRQLAGFDRVMVQQADCGTILYFEL